MNREGKKGKRSLVTVYSHHFQPCSVTPSLAPSSVPTFPGRLLLGRPLAVWRPILSLSVRDSGTGPEPKEIPRLCVCLASPTSAMGNSDRNSGEQSLSLSPALDMCVSHAQGCQIDQKCPQWRLDGSAVVKYS